MIDFDNEIDALKVMIDDYVMRRDIKNKQVKAEAREFKKDIFEQIDKIKQEDK